VPMRQLIRLLHFGVKVVVAFDDFNNNRLLRVRAGPHHYARARTRVSAPSVNGP